MLGAACAHGADITIDGAFSDWHDVPVAITDPIDAPGAELDFGEVRVVSDGRFLHVLAYIGAEVNVQRLDGRGLLLVDGDGDPATGAERYGLAGVDAMVVLTPPGRQGRSGMGVGAAAATDDGDVALSPYDLGITFAPTHANRTVELRVERAPGVAGLETFLAGSRCSLKLVLLSPDGAVADETDAFTHDLAPFERSAASAAPVAVDRARPGDLRVVSWNTRFGALVQNPRLAGEIVAALDPDILLLQEMTDKDSAEAVAAVLNGALPEGTNPKWRVTFGRGGGNLRSAVASRHAMERVPQIEPIPYPHQPGRFLRTAGAAVRVGDRRVLAVSVHLKCCGRIADSSDVKREVEATAIRAAVLAAHTEDPADAIIVGGDLNLVGGRRPLEILREGIDVNGSDLAIAGPLRLDARSNATWLDPASAFVAGRLDYLLYADARLGAARSFVFDTHDLDAATLRRYGLERADVRTVSDHLPVVVDLRAPGTARSRDRGR
jgi:endonuclease/exonuclease/phosphatase family metal-dependent hydrolase